MKYKLLLLDVDGTLVKNKDAPVSPLVIQAIRRIKNTLVISLCTGRTKKDVQRVIDILGISNSYHVIESGAKVLNLNGKEENVKDIPQADVTWILEVANNAPAGFGFCVNGVWVDTLNQIGDGQVTTVSLHSHDQEQTKRIIETIKPISKKYHVAVGSHWQIPEGNFILITNKRANKGSAIAYIQNKLGIKKQETIGVGDMPNDLPLFEASSLKVAMGNADEELKRRSDIVVPSIDKDGVAYFISTYLL